MTAAAVRRNGPYAPLSANYADDDAIAALDIEENDRAELLWARGIAYCARDLRLNGFISDVALAAGKVLRRRPGKKNVDTVLAAAQRLVDLGLWVREPTGFRIRTWSKWNRTWEEVEHKRATDRGRKSSGSEPDDDPPPHGRRTESTGNGDGSRAESARIPRGTVTESLSRASAGGALQKHVTSEARHDTTRSTGTSDPDAAAAAGTPPATTPPPPKTKTSPNLPQAVAGLRERLDDLGLVVRWDRLTAGELMNITELIEVHGPKALVDAAQRAWQVNNPASSASAWLGLWRDLRPPRPRVKAQLCPADPSHGQVTGVCSACASERKAAVG